MEEGNIVDGIIESKVSASNPILEVGETTGTEDADSTTA